MQYLLFFFLVLFTSYAEAQRCSDSTFYQKLIVQTDTPTTAAYIYLQQADTSALWLHGSMHFPVKEQSEEISLGPCANPVLMMVCRFENGDTLRTEIMGTNGKYAFSVLLKRWERVKNKRQKLYHWVGNIPLLQKLELSRLISITVLQKASILSGGVPVQDASYPIYTMYIPQDAATILHTAAKCHSLGKGY